MRKAASAPKAVLRIKFAIRPNSVPSMNLLKGPGQGKSIPAGMKVVTAPPKAPANGNRLPLVHVNLA